MPRLFSYGALRQKAVQLATFGRLLEDRQRTIVRVDDQRDLRTARHHRVAAPPP